MKHVDDLVQHLNLQEIDSHNYSGTSQPIGGSNVFGGQVLAQALNAAYKTIAEERTVHSLHSYFLLPGNLNIPITYNVSEMRNGGSFSTRRVTATQEDRTIFILAASFHKKENGYDHQEAMELDLKQPEELLSWNQMAEQFGDFIPSKLKAFLGMERPMDFKPVEIPNPMVQEDLPAVEDVWFKLKGDTSKLDLPMKQQILTYISDYNILRPTIKPHMGKAAHGTVQMASLDHSMWFFRDFDFDDWLLFSSRSPSTSGARGFATANIFTRDGKLVASLAQEGLLRPKTR